MKRAVQYTYTFTPSAFTLDLSEIPNFNVQRLYAVLDLSPGANTILYAAGTPGLGFASISGGVLLLQASMAGCTALDNLMVLYDDGDQATTAAAQYVQLVTGNNVVDSSHELPVILDAENSGLALDATVAAVVAALGNIGAGAPTLPGSSLGVMGLLRLLAEGASTQGIGANGAPIVGNPVLVAGFDGTYTRTLLTDAGGSLVTRKATWSSLNITAPVAAKGAAGVISAVSVLTPGTTAGSVNDCALVVSISNPGNQLFSIPNTVGLFALDAPCLDGICITPGAGQVLAAWGL